MGGVTSTRASDTGASPFLDATAPIDASDDEIRRAVDEAEIPPLLPALAYVTGDLTLLRDDLQPDPRLIALPQGGLSEEQQALARELALDVLIRFRDGGSRPAPPPSPDELVRIMEFAVGQPDMFAYVPLLEEELALRGEDRRGPDWTKSQVAPDRELSVAVIGAGMSGLLAAYRLSQAEVPFAVFEKNADVGGTWFENTYPGCRVDNPNHNYSYSFAQRHDWPLHFSSQDVLLDYFQHCTQSFGLRERIRFGTEVLSATWSDDDARWTLAVRRPDGAEEVVVADAIVSAVGQLNRPNVPDIPGRDAFAGPSFHSARWDHHADLRGKRVAVIGTGASAVQFVPEIAEIAARVVVFQRTPPWLAPTPEYHDGVPHGLRWLYAHVPSYSEWNRFWIFWKMGDASLPNVRVDPDWSRSDSVSAANDFMRAMLTAYIEAEFADRPDLVPKVVPTYPVGAKRILRDNGVWARALKRENVELVTEPIREITRDAIVTVDGRDHAVDVIVYGTGFRASEFLMPMSVTGRGGVDLHERWDGDARAYLGITVPGFPNLFCLYGPNTNIVINGSIIYFSECEVRYVLGCIELLLRGRHRALEVRADVHDAYNERVDAENLRMAWGASDVNSWYKNAHGHVAQNWPFSLLEFWRRTLRPDPDDFELT
jgi:4-hydroxyacetophenone monooxygenase